MRMRPLFAAGATGIWARIRSHAWDELAPGLAITISVGVGEKSIGEGTDS